MIEIKNSEGIVLYPSETASDLRAALVEAVGKKANLRGANLGGANLREADLYEADLGGTDLASGSPIRWTL